MVVFSKDAEIVVGGEKFDGAESVYWIANIIKVTGTRIYFKFPGYDPVDGRTEYWDEPETVGEWQTRYVNDVVVGKDICVKTTGKNGREKIVPLLQSFEAEVEAARVQAAEAQAAEAHVAAAGEATPGKAGCSKCKGLTACSKCMWKVPAPKKRKTPSKA
jgi:hypothetical protein